MGREMQVNIFSIFSLGKDRGYLFPADIMTLDDVIGFHVFIRFSCLLYSFCHVRSFTFKFVKYTMSNKYNNSLDTRNSRLSVPPEINVVSHSLKLVTENINFTRDRSSVIPRYS